MAAFCTLTLFHKTNEVNISFMTPKNHGNKQANPAKKLIAGSANSSASALHSRAQFALLFELSIFRAAEKLKNPKDTDQKYRKEIFCTWIKTFGPISKKIIRNRDPEIEPPKTRERKRPPFPAETGPALAEKSAAAEIEISSAPKLVKIWAKNIILTL